MYPSTLPCVCHHTSGPACALLCASVGSGTDGLVPSLSFPYNRSRSAVTARRDATSRKELVERTRNGFHHLTEALNTRSAFGDDGGKVGKV